MVTLVYNDTIYYINTDNILYFTYSGKKIMIVFLDHMLELVFDDVATTKETVKKLYRGHH